MCSQNASSFYSQQAVESIVGIPPKSKQQAIGLIKLQGAIPKTFTQQTATGDFLGLLSNCPLLCHHSINENKQKCNRKHTFFFFRAAFQSPLIQLGRKILARIYPQFQFIFKLELHNDHSSFFFPSLPPLFCGVKGGRRVVASIARIGPAIKFRTLLHPFRCC